MTHIMLDLEMNSLKKVRNEKGDTLSNELIEIGAVKMDDEYEITDKFQTYVHPVYGQIAPNITRLTGITDEKVEGAPLFEEAFHSFTSWIGGGSVTYYSWSMSDINFFKNESRFKGQCVNEVREMERHWVDFQKEYAKLLGIHRRIKLDQAVSSADYKFTGDQHTALADAMNTAEIFILSKHEDEFNKVMKPVIDLFKPEPHGSTLLDLCPDFFKDFEENTDA